MQHVLHDNGPPAAPTSISLIEPSGGRTNNFTPIVSFSGGASDTGLSGFSAYEARVISSGTVSVNVFQDWAPIESGQQITLDDSLSTFYGYYVEVRGIDKAGNQSQVVRSTTFAAAGTVQEFQAGTGTVAPTFSSEADLDGDGDIDLVSFSNYDKKLRWFENDGSEVFTSNLIDNSVFEVLAVTDFDADGDFDILTVDTGNSLSIYRNDGTGSFAPFLIGVSGPHDFETVDYDSDGDLDIVGSDRTGTGTVLTVYYNRGELFFEAILALDSSLDLSHKWLDFNGDGHMNYVAQDTDKLTWGKKATSGEIVSLESWPFTSPIYYTDIGDVDSDGKADIVGCNSSRDQIYWERNTGTGFQRSLIDTPLTDISYLKIADLDKDGDADIVYSISSSIDQGLYFLQNDGSQNFTRSKIHAAGVGVFDLFDYNEDGHWDVVVSSGKDVLVNNGSQVFSATGGWWTGQGGRSHKQVDLDLDGDLDILTGSWNGQEYKWLNHDGSGGYVGNNILANPARIKNSAVGDFDGDTYDDILIVDDQSNVYWLENNGSNQFLTSHAIPKTNDMYGNMNLKVIDLDEDGDVDIVINGGSGSTGMHWYENNGSGSFTEHNFLLTGGLRTMPSFIDFDNDGDIDFVTGDASSSLGNISLYSNNGSEVFTKSVILTYDFLVDVQAFDADGDGDNDIVFLSRDFTDKGLYLLVNEGPMGFSQSGIDTTLDYINSRISTRDLDSDGDSEILVSDVFETYFYSNDGSNSYTKFASPFIDADMFLYSDFDGDGDEDIALGGYGFRDIVIMKNNGSLSFETKFIYHPESDSSGLSLINLDADLTDKEIFSGNRLDGALRYLKPSF